MAQPSVLIRIPCSDFQVAVAAENLTVTDDVSGKYFYCYISEGTKTGTITYNIALENLAQITSIKLPYLFSNPEDGGTVTLTAKVSGSSYAIDSSGNMPSAMITHINEYRSQNNVYPTIQLIVQLTAVNDSTECFITALEVTYSIAGGNVSVYPVADVQVAHTILEGFAGIYQLLNEPVADNDATCIYSPQGSTGSSGSGAGSNNAVSIVKLGSLPRLRDIKQIVIGICIKFNGPSHTTLNLYSPEFTASISARYDDSLDGTWLNLTQIFPSTCAFVQSYEEYCRNNLTPPELFLEIDTWGSCRSTGDKYGTAGSCNVSQVYVEAAYQDVGTGIYQKQGATWKEATAAYQKVNGIWIQITENAYKSALQERLVLVEN